MYVKKILALAILLTICQAISAEYNVDAYCTLVANGVRLGSPDDCLTYYTCMNGKATMSTCAGGLAYDKNAQTCKPKSDVNCFSDTEQPCQGRDQAFVPVMNTCNGYIYCENNVESARGQCPMKMVFKNGACIYGDCDDNINTGGGTPDFQTVCDIMPNGVFFGSTLDCQIYQKCIKDELTHGSCPGTYVFDVQNSNCNFRSGSMCSRVTGIDIQPDPPKSEPCTGVPQNAKKPDRKQCSVYYECDGTNWVPHSCGANMYYSIVSKSCQYRESATPDLDCNRCEYSRNQFVNSVDPDCRGYQVCSNGAVQSFGSCSVGSYFDEMTQSCLADTKGLSSYASKNGACADCSALCGTQDSTCSDISSCTCAAQGSACVFCPAGVNASTKKCNTCSDVCKAFSTSNCKKSGDCDCGLNSSNKCDNCENGADASGKCIDCTALCTGLATAACKTNGACNCGLDDSNVCSLCSEPADADNKCPPPPDCSTTCSSQDATDCAPANSCECALTDSTTSATCAECASGVIGDNNICDETCADTCALITDPTECKPETGTLECNCGLNVAGGTDCEECAEIVNSAGACETCADFCGGITDMADCVSTPPCDCEEDANNPGACIVGS